MRGPLNRLLILGLLCLCGCSDAVPSDRPLVRQTSQLKEDTLRDLLSYHAIRYAERDGVVGLRASMMRKMVDASFLGADIFPHFKVGGEQVSRVERAVFFLSYGYGETRWKPSTPSFNTPGYTPGVRWWSVDIWWVGINEQHLYGKKNIRSEAVKLQKAGKLPKDIEFMWPPSKRQFDRLRAEYKAQKRRGVKPSKMTFKLRLHEESYDNIASALIYRILIEQERQNRGWTAEYYSEANKKAMTYLLNHIRTH